MKKLMRKSTLEQRNALSTDVINEKSHSIFIAISKEKAYSEANTIMSFMSFGSEINMEDFNKDIIEKKGYVIIPRVNTQTKVMDLYKVTDFKDFVLSNYGIWEPDPDKYTTITPTELDLILCPGVVFDKKGYRIGYGGGFYDKLLSEINSTCLLYGVGFGLQLVDEVPRESFDKQLDKLFTEKNNYLFERRFK